MTYFERSPILYDFYFFPSLEGIPVFYAFNIKGQEIDLILQ